MKAPKGTLLLIGGSEDRGPAEHTPAIADVSTAYEAQEILRFLIQEAPAAKPRIEVVVTASTIPEEVGQMYQRVFRQFGQPHVGVLDIRDRLMATSPAVIARLNQAHVVLFSSGDQFRLGTLFGGTPFARRLLERYRTEPIVVAGTSAGAMALSTTMLYEGHTEEAMLRGDVKIAAGLGLFDYGIVDTHFIRRGRFSRLAQAVLTNPTCLGIGLGEDTALFIRRGVEAQCLGSGMVVVIDGRRIGATNVADVPDGTPLYVEGLLVHALVAGNRFHLLKRQFSPK